MITAGEILSVLIGLKRPEFEIDVLDDAWYSPRAMLNAVGSEHATEYPKVSVVRVKLVCGVLELHPIEEDKVYIKCYCCFGGNPDQGIVSLDELEGRVLSLKDHRCPPWPG